jgi:sortase (surface protein transpeptidase)
VGEADGGRGHTVTAALAVLGLIVLGGGLAHRPPPGPSHEGPPALGHIPAGDALPWAAPIRVDIPSAGVRAPLIALGQKPDGTVEVPPFSQASSAGWYRYGPAPGTRGSAVVLGHVDDLRGAAAFYRLGGVRPGAVVRVSRNDGVTAEFRVDAVEKVRKSRFPADRVYGAVPYAGLRLVTCGGSFDRRKHSYRDSIIVYAHLVTGRHGAR